MATYATNLQLARFMGVIVTIPNSEVTARENVGTGDNSADRFFLDHAGIIGSTYIFSYGTVETSITALVETTDYTLNLETGIITLTAAGITAVGTNVIFAEYSYNQVGLTDQLLTDALDRAENEIDAFTNNHFVDGTGATPAWNQHLNEVQDGKGGFDRNHFSLQNYPVPNVTTLVNGAITADDTTITVDSTSGFPSEGSILIEADKILYTGKTSTTFTGCTSVAAHVDNSTVLAFVVETSTTSPGGAISWDVLEEGVGFDFDRDTGRVQLYSSGNYAYGTYLDDTGSPPKGVASRVRLSYLSGVSTIPDRVEKAALMLASKDLMSIAVRKATVGGLNSFNPSLLEVDSKEFERLLMNLRNEQFVKV